MKKNLLFIFALLCAVAQGAWAQNVVDLSNVTSDYVAQNGDVLTGNLVFPVKISIANNAEITLRDAIIIGVDDDDYEYAGITCLGDATITLEGNNRVCGNYEVYPGIMLGPANTTLTIKGVGSLDVSSNSYAPGIGSYYNYKESKTYGNLTIEGGNITAYGGDAYSLSEHYGIPAIGATPGATIGSITLKGGTIHAYGGKVGAGIGTGYDNQYDTSGYCRTITIDGSTVYAYGSESAGIGAGGWRNMKAGVHNGCHIHIISGYVYAKGGEGSAGIGGGNWHNGGNIIIDGGTIFATGGDDGAGIGGGTEAWGGTIVINGGTIEAKGGAEAAGIGGGEDGYGGDIFINDGDITATGGKYGAGIGGGDGASGGAILIAGGTVKAYGGKDAAGIGGGEDGDSGSIVINGGDVYASGDGWGVGIGAGEDGDVDNTISINGGTVDAYGGLDIRRAIGGEDSEDYSLISIGQGMSITDVSDVSKKELLPYHLRGYFLSLYIRLKFEPCDHAGQTLSYAYLDNEKHRFYCKWCGIMDEAHTGQFECTKCIYNETPHYVNYYEMVYNEKSQTYGYQKVASEVFKNSLVLPAHHGTVPADRVFARWTAVELDANDDGIVKEDSYHLWPAGQYISTDVSVLNIKARYAYKTLDLATVQSDQKLYDGMIVTGTLNTASYPVKITIADGATVTLSNVDISGVNNASYKWAGITCEGNATIILAEGTTNIVKGFYEYYPGIFVPASSILTIDGEGSLNASSNGFGAGIGGGYDGDECGVISINGGNITATGGKYAAGIGSSYRNSCSHIIISGGTINATGGEYAAGIGSGWGGIKQGDISITNGVTSVTAIKGKDAPYSIGASDGNTSTITIGKVKTGPISESPYTYYPSLDVSGDMTADLEEVMGKTLDVTFRGRKFIIDSEWNTLCLPFSMTAEQINNSPLNNSKIVELDTEKTTLSDGVLTIAYKTTTAIEAGKPYMVKWIIDEETEDTHIDNPIFKNVTISASAPTAVSAAGISFTGTFAPLALANGDKTKLWLDDDVRLRWVSGQEEQVSPTWCYWNLNGLDASTLNAIVVTFDDGSRPIVELMDGMTDFSILSAFGEQEVNASLEGRELSAVQQADGTWQSRAYTLCLPFYAELFGTGCDFTIYSKAEVTENNELLFTEEMLPFLYPGNAYLIVVNEGTLRLQEESVTLTAEAKEADDASNAVLLNYVDEQTAGYWLGSLKTIGHDEAVSRKAFTLASDGSFQRITDEYPTWKWPAYRAMFCATDLMTADKLTTKYQLDANGEEEEDRSLPAPDSYQGDNDGEATGIAPVIHTIDLDGTERWFDLSGRQLSGKPTKKGVYIHRGKKQVVK